MASHFSFSRFTLPAAPGEKHSERIVHPRLQRFSAWISAVGAAVALADIDGDGLSNDMCWVDTRTNLAQVAPAPATGDRYAAFILEPAPLGYDPATMAPMGCLPGDFNADGLTDLLVYYWGRPPIIFLQREAPATEPRSLSRSLFRPVDLVPTLERWYTNAVTQADFDGDGRIDLMIGNYFPDGSNLLDPHATNPAEMQGSMSRADNGGHNHLFLGQGGTGGGEPTALFQEAKGVLEGRADTGWTLALGAADLDGDLLPELYVVNDFGPDVLLHNRSHPGDVHFAPLYGRKTFTTPSSKVLGRDSFKGMGIDFADLNGDGRLDIYVSNLAAEFALEESHFVWMSTGDVASMRAGIAPYVDAGEPLGLSRSDWSWDCRFFDFDNDGVPEAIQATGFARGSTNRWPQLHELALGNDNMLHRPGAWPRLQAGDDLSGHARNPFFVRGPSGLLRSRRRRSTSRRLDEPRSRRRGCRRRRSTGFRGGESVGRPVFLPQRKPRRRQALELDVRLPVESEPRATVRSSPAIGAVVTLTMPDGKQRVEQVDGGTGHSGKRSPEIHFGLGALSSATALRVDIAYRDRTGTIHRECVLPAARPPCRPAR